MHEVSVRKYLEERGHKVDWRPDGYGHGEIYVDDKYISKRDFRFDPARGKHYATPDIIRNACWKSGIAMKPDPKKEPGKAFFVTVIIIAVVVLIATLLTNHWRW